MPTSALAIRDATKPRQIVLDRASLHFMNRSLREGIDLRNAIVELDLYEDVFSHTMSGFVILQDIESVVDLGPIIGEELLVLRFQRPGEPVYEGAFRVTKLTNREFLREEKQVYELHFVTPEFVRSLTSRLSRAFKNVTCSTAIQQILTDDLKTRKPRVRIEATKQPVTFTIPWYSPFDTIQFFTSRALTNHNPPQANYVFYETLEGFHFVSLSTLVEQESVARLQSWPRNLGVKFPPKLVVPERWYVQESFDVLRDIEQGLFRSKTIGVDVLRHSFQEIDSDYSSSFNSRKHLDPHPFYTESHANTVQSDVRVYLVPTNTYAAQDPKITSKDPSITRTFLEDTVDLRRRQMQEIRHQRLLVTCPGSVGIRAGSVVDVHLPAARLDVALTEKAYQRADTYYSGRYLVTSCRHRLTNVGSKFEYRVQLECSKDSLGQRLGTAVG